MAGETPITVVGNLVADPELRFTPSGAAVVSFTVASTPRVYDRQSGQWRDGEPLFLRCSLWRDAAENVAESLTKGARVIVVGQLAQRSYETREGEKRTVVEVRAEEVGPSLRYATARVQRMQRGGQAAYAPQAVAAPAATQTAAQASAPAVRQGEFTYSAPAGGTASDPWATGGATNFGDEPPF